MPSGFHVDTESSACHVRAGCHASLCSRSLADTKVSLPYRMLISVGDPAGIMCHSRSVLALRSSRSRLAAESGADASSTSGATFFTMMHHGVSSTKCICDGRKAITELLALYCSTAQFSSLETAGMPYRLTESLDSNHNFHLVGLSFQDHGSCLDVFEAPTTFPRAPNTLGKQGLQEPVVFKSSDEFAESKMPQSRK